MYFEYNFYCKIKLKKVVTGNEITVTLNVLKIKG